MTTNYNNILVIVKHLIKYSKFIPINESHLTKDFVDIIIQKIISNHRLPGEFITNKGIIFVLQFFIIFIMKLRVNSKLSIAIYLQTDKQIKRFN